MERDYGAEFDQEVARLNEWLKKPQGRRYLVFGIRKPPLYERDDLTGYQKDSISIASDYVRVGERIEAILAGDPMYEEDDVWMTYVEARECKEIVSDLYEQYRNLYISSFQRD